MGQHSCHCKEAENIDNCTKKKRFRLLRWISCWTAGETYNSAQGDGELLVSEAAPGQLGRIPDDHGSVRQVICTVEKHNLQEPSARDPGVLSAAEKHVTLHPDVNSPFLSGHITKTPFNWSTDICQTLVLNTASDYSSYVMQSPDHTLSQWSIDSGLTPACTMSSWNTDVAKTPAHTMSDWSIGMMRTPAYTMSDWSIDMMETLAHTSFDWSTDITETLVRTVSEWKIDVTQTPVHTASDWSIDATQAPVNTASDWNIDATQAPVHTASDWSINITKGLVNKASDWSIDATQAPVHTASDWSIDATQAPVCTTSDRSTDATQAPVHTASDWSIDATQAPLCTVSDWSIDATQAPVHTASDWSIDATQAQVCTASDWSIDVTQAPVHTASDWSIDATQAPVHTASDRSTDATQAPVHTASDWSIDATQAPLCTVSDWSIDATQAPVHTASDWSIDATQAQVCTASDWSIDATQAPVHTASDWSIDATQAPVHTASDWSIDATQAPVHMASKWINDIGQTPVRRTLSDWCTDATQIPVLTASECSNVTHSSARKVSDWFIKVGQSRVCTKVSSSRQRDSNGKMKSQVINSCHYVIGDMLGEGNFGAVYEGSRLKDGFKVAVKYVRKTEDVHYISIPGHSKPLPLEIALLILANRGPSVPEIIQLLDWQDQHDQYIMVLECPSPCEDLFDFSERHGGSIDEGEARVVMRQATQAACMCCHRGVLHRDIKLENLLINKETHKVKLIDFGCGDLLKTSPYKIFTGTDQYCPPEFEDKGEYNGKPATVWSLGILLFALVCGDYPNTHDLHEINANNYFKAGLSDECCRLISSCLQRNPERRLQLSKILLHEWFKVSDMENLTTL